MSIGSIFLQTSIDTYKSTEKLGHKTLMQLSYAELHMQPSTESNSIAIIVKHLNGHMLSRWTDFLTTDGEKQSRDRDAEFEGGYASREALLEAWHSGWETMFETLNELKEEDLLRTITIRGESLTVIETVTKQLQHYGYHVGQIVYIGKQIKNTEWQQLSNPKKTSRT
ncbi:Protein of unknown function [Paenibacillus sp. 1_12]|uniref:DUF1572 family protein n=1 Tax=Paenibacillus sp. 1_12 TaxID=1566278 RepID=UPI0008E43E1F|nr:DUF1572 family protein [Paenibacillus sp. 1_12]SFL43630.1 Protein of unknown function [Paenibacillus sp. 1_12]